MNRYNKLEEHVRKRAFGKHMYLRQTQQEILEQLHDHDCHLVSVDKGDKNLNYVYSVGLWHSYKHPEIITVGLPENIGKLLIWDIRNLIKLKQAPVIGTSLGHAIGYYPIQLDPLRDRQIMDQYLPMVSWFYGEDSCPVLQMFWSDPKDLSFQNQVLQQAAPVS